MPPYLALDQMQSLSDVALFSVEEARQAVI